MGNLPRPGCWTASSTSTSPGKPFGAGLFGMGDTEGVKLGHHGAGRDVSSERRRADAAVLDHVETARQQDYASRWLPGVDAQRVVPQTCTSTSTVDSDFVIDRIGPVRDGGIVDCFSPVSGHAPRSDVTLGV